MNNILLILWSILLLFSLRQWWRWWEMRGKQKPNSLVGKYARVRQAVFLLILFLGGLALLQPTRWITTKDGEGKGVDVMVMLDVSKSMKVADIAYQGRYRIDRLTTAKNLLAKLVSESKGNRRWLGVFAGEALGMSPLTSDTNLFLTFLQGVDENNVRIWGTNLVQALQVGIDRFDPSDQQRGKVLFLISDGGEEKITIPSAIKQAIAEQGIFVVTIWLGTLEGWAVPEGQDIRWETLYKSQEGNTIISKFNPSTLQSMASSLHGKFFHITSLDDTRKIIKSFAHLEKTALEQVWWTKPRILSPYLLWIALLLFLWWIVLGLDEKVVERMRNVFTR